MGVSARAVSVCAITAVLATSAVAGAADTATDGVTAAAPSPIETATAIDLGSLEVAPPTASVSEGGLRLELWLDRTTIAPGERLTAITRISNEGVQATPRETNICADGPVPTTIELTRPADQGLAWDGNAARFKERLLAEVWAPDALQDPSMLGAPDAGCTAASRIEPFEPGMVDGGLVVWDAVDRPGRPLNPGPATVSASFEGRLRVEVPVEVVGQPGTERSVEDYIDAALGDTRFRAWLDQEREPRTWAPFATYWPNADGDYPDRPRYEGATDGAVDIGMFVDTSRWGFAVVDIPTLVILGRTLDRQGR